MDLGEPRRAIANAIAIKRQTSILTYGLPSQNRTFRIFVCRFAARQDDDLGWSVESGGAEASARDEGGRAASDLRDRRPQERGRDGVGGRGGYERREESAGEDQSGEGAGASGVAGGGEGEQVVRGFSFGAAGKTERGAADERAVQIFDGRVNAPPFCKKMRDDGAHRPYKFLVRE